MKISLPPWPPSISITSLLLLLTTPILALSPRQNGCTNPTIRREWSSVSQAQRDSYTNAVMCMTRKPSKIRLSTSRFDDFTWVHRQMFGDIHINGPDILAQFLPWHRYFAHIYEQELQACGYRGSMLYWDWGQSASDPLNAAIFSDPAGLGGNGVSSPACQYIPGNRVARQCVVSGPFAQLRPAYYQGSTVPHSLHRCFNCGSPTMFNASWTQAVVFNVLLQSTYNRFSTELYIGPHLSIHDAIGGDFPTTTSPNEPLFWPHHVQVDRVWWIWQNLDPANRMFQYEGKTVIGNSPPTRAVLADVMHVLGLASDAPVSQVMNTEGGFLCYRYDGL